MTTKKVGELVQADIGKTATYEGPPGNTNTGTLNQASHFTFGTSMMIGSDNITVNTNDANQTVDIQDTPTAQ